MRTHINLWHYRGICHQRQISTAGQIIRKHTPNWKSYPNLSTIAPALGRRGPYVRVGMKYLYVYVCNPAAEACIFHQRKFINGIRPGAWNLQGDIKSRMIDRSLTRAKRVPSWFLDWTWRHRSFLYTGSFHTLNFFKMHWFVSHFFVNTFDFTNLGKIMTFISCTCFPFSSSSLNIFPPVRLICHF